MHIYILCFFFDFVQFIRLDFWCMIWLYSTIITRSCWLLFLIKGTFLAKIFLWDVSFLPKNVTFNSIVQRTSVWIMDLFQKTNRVKVDFYSIIPEEWTKGILKCYKSCLKICRNGLNKASGFCIQFCIMWVDYHLWQTNVFIDRSDKNWKKQKLNLLTIKKLKLILFLFCSISYQR